jgi:integrase
MYSLFVRYVASSVNVSLCVILEASRMSPPPPSNLAALLRLIERGDLCDARQSREMASAIRSIGAWTRMSLDRLPADPGVLRRHLENLNAAMVGVSAGRFANVRSLLKRALCLSGVKATNRPVAEAVTPAWRDLLGLLDGAPYIRTSLAPFARYCAAGGIEPSDVCNDVAAGYLEHLTQVSLTKKPQTTHQTVCRAWEQARTSISGWPASALVIPIYAEHWTLPLSAFPRSLQDETEAYLRRLVCAEPADLLDDSAPLRPLKTSSAKTKRYQFRQFASALALSGIPAQEIRSLAVLARPENFKAALKVILGRTRKDITNTTTAGMIAHTISSMAKYHLGLPASELIILQNVTRRLGRRILGMTEKNLDHLAQFQDDEVLRSFLLFPANEMDHLLHGGVKTRAQALRYSLLLSLEILIFAPMRINNLAGLRIEQDIRINWHDDGEITILIGRNAVKNGEQLQYCLPAASSRYLKIFLMSIRPMLERTLSDFLFSSGSGSAKRSDTISKQISRLVEDGTGIRFYPHLMRHLAAMISSKASPGNIELPRRLLGHRSSETTIGSYDGFGMAVASKVHSDLIGSLRQHTSTLGKQLSQGQREPNSASSRRSAPVRRMKTKPARPDSLRARKRD